MKKWKKKKYKTLLIMNELLKGIKYSNFLFFIMESKYLEVKIINVDKNQIKKKIIVI